MAKAKLEAAIEKILSSDQHEVLSENAISKPDPSFFGKLADQRHSQRKWLFCIAMAWLSISLICLFGLIIFNAYLRTTRSANFSLFNQYEMEVLSVSVFGQLIGIIAIIAKSLWDEGPLSKLLEKDYDETHKQG